MINLCSRQLTSAVVSYGRHRKRIQTVSCLRTGDPGCGEERRTPPISDHWDHQEWGKSESSVVLSERGPASRLPALHLGTAIYELCNLE